MGDPLGADGQPPSADPAGNGACLKPRKVPAPLDPDLYLADGRLLNVVDAQKISAQADELLREDSFHRCSAPGCDQRDDRHDGADHPFVAYQRASGRGLADYMRGGGMDSKKLAETRVKHEASISYLYPDDAMSQAAQLDLLASRQPDRRSTRRPDTD